MREGEIEVLSVSSLFLTWVGVYVGVCVCIRAHTHTLHICTHVYVHARRWDEILH